MVIRGLIAREGSAHDLSPPLITERVRRPERLIIKWLAGSSSLDQTLEELLERLPRDLVIARRIAPGSLFVRQIPKFPSGELAVNLVDGIEKLPDFGCVILDVKLQGAIDRIFPAMFEGLVNLWDDGTMVPSLDRLAEQRFSA